MTSVDNSLNLSIGSEILERIGNDCKIKSYKFIGHHLDEHITWEPHINHIYSKLASANFMISNAKNLLPLNLRLTLYNSLFKSHLQFGILAWGNAPKKYLKKICTLQKKCVRNVANKHFRSHTDPIFSSLKILKIENILRYESLIYMHNYAYARLPPTMLDMFTPLKTNSRNGHYLLKKYKSSFCDRFPSSFLPKIWNHNSKNIKNILKTSSVKTKLRNEIFSTYNEIETCDYDLCPDCQKI